MAARDTPATTAARRAGIEFAVHEYEHDPALPTLVDETALEHGTVFVSAGRRGLEIELAPQDLVALTRATVRPLRRRLRRSARRAGARRRSARRPRRGPRRSRSASEPGGSAAARTGARRRRAGAR